MSTEAEPQPVTPAPEPVVEETEDGKQATVPKTYLCSGCDKKFPETDYSSAQLKKKGKRKCKTCAAEAAAAPVPNISKKELEAKLTVKHVKAEDLKRVQIKDTGDSLIPASDADKYDVFLDWLRKGKVKFPLLHLKFYTVDYRGIHAKERVKNNQRILEVPLDMIMTSEVAKASDIGRKILASSYSVRSTHSYLAAYLCQERHNPTSKWKPYIDTLPQHYRNMPIYFDADELKYLKGSFTLQMIDDRKESLRSEYEGICGAVPDFRKYTLDEFIWARLAVITRIFGMKIRDLKTDGLVPMADMLNHRVPKETSWTFDDECMGFTITASKTLLRGAQIYDSYGRKCNSRFFVNYGFSLEENEDNQVAMFFELPKDEPAELRSLKARLVGDWRRRYQIPALYEEKVTKTCFSYLRIAHMKFNELVHLHAWMTAGGNIKRLEPISIENEWLVCQTLGKAALEIQAGFPQTLEEDMKLLEDPESKLTMNIRNAILQRRGEKRVLRHYIELAQLSDKWRTCTPKQFRLDLAKVPSESMLGKYLHECWVPLFKEAGAAEFDAKEGEGSQRKHILQRRAEEVRARLVKEKRQPVMRKLDDPDSSDSD